MNLKFNWIFKFGCLSMISLIGLGARYGHQGRLSPESTTLFNKAQLYHLINNIALFVMSLSGKTAISLPGKVALGGFTCGLLLFCAPMYYSAAIGTKSSLSKLNPIGGVGMLLGWGALMFA